MFAGHHRGGNSPGTESLRLSSEPRRRPFQTTGNLTTLACAVTLQACAPAPQSAQGFRLPDGDPDRGIAAFTAMHCNACHTVEGLDIAYLGTGPQQIGLGGKTTRVKTYGELVTSIINPSHRLAPGYRPGDGPTDHTSPMSRARLNDVMTVQQLTDLVAFLQAQYQVVPPDYDPYQLVYP